MRQNLQEWLTKVGGPLGDKLVGERKFTLDELEVVGNKAILEISGSATQKNGKPYNNRYA